MSGNKRSHASISGDFERLNEELAEKVKALDDESKANAAEFILGKLLLEFPQVQFVRLFENEILDEFRDAKYRVDQRFLIHAVLNLSDVEEQTQLVMKKRMEELLKEKNLNFEELVLYNARDLIVLLDERYNIFKE